MTNEERIEALEKMIMEILSKLVFTQIENKTQKAVFLEYLNSTAPDLIPGYKQAYKNRFNEAVPYVIERYKTIPSTLKVLLETSVKETPPFDN